MPAECSQMYTMHIQMCLVTNVHCLDHVMLFLHGSRHLTKFGSLGACHWAKLIVKHAPCRHAHCRFVKQHLGLKLYLHASQKADKEQGYTHLLLASLHQLNSPAKKL